MDNNIKVTIWGKEVGRLTWDASRKRSIFEYAPNFLKGELDIAPLTASIYDRRNRLPFYGEANNGVFYGLPAFISDSLPGKWGDTVFSAWASANNLDEDHLTAVDKLSFIGKRGMGALEFEPSQEIGTGEMSLELDQLYRKAQEILEQREETVIAGKDITHHTSSLSPPSPQSATAQPSGQACGSDNPNNTHAPTHQTSAAASAPSAQGSLHSLPA